MAGFLSMANINNSAVTAYDKLKTAYNDGLSKEETRAGDFFKASFEPKITIPVRPCPPEQPPAYAGFTPYFGADALSAFTEANKIAM